MIKPHGSNQLTPLFVEDKAKRNELIVKAEKLPSIILSATAAANAIMIGAGYFTPLRGYMNLADTLSVAEVMHTNRGLFWPIPIINCTNDISAIKGVSRIALRDPNVEGNPVLAIQEVDAIESISAE